MNAVRESQSDELPDLPESLDTTVILPEEPVPVIEVDSSRCASVPTLSRVEVPTMSTRYDSMPNLSIVAGLGDEPELSKSEAVNKTQSSPPDTIPKLRRSSRVSMKPERFSPY